MSAPNSFTLWPPIPSGRTLVHRFLMIRELGFRIMKVKLAYYGILSEKG